MVKVRSFRLNRPPIAIEIFIQSIREKKKREQKQRIKMVLANVRDGEGQKRKMQGIERTEKCIDVEKDETDDARTAETKKTFPTPRACCHAKHG